MRAKIIALFTTLFVFYQASSQADAVDLQGGTYSLKDTVMVDEWLDLSQDYLYTHSNPDSSIYWAQNALQIAVKINYKEGQRTASYILGLNYTNIHQTDSSLMYYEKSTEISRELYDTLWTAISLQASGKDYSLTGRYKRALEYYFESLKLRQSLGDSSRLSWPLNNIGTVYFRQKNYDKALEYYLKTYELDKEYSPPVEQASTLGNIGMVYQNLKKYHQSLDYLNRSYEMLDSLGEKCRIIYATLNLAVTYVELGDQQEAEKLFRITYDGGKDCQNPEAVSNALLGLGNIYMQQGLMVLAEKSLMEAYNIAERNDFKATQLEISDSIYELYKSKGEYKIALEFLEVHKLLKDELFNEDLTEQLTTMELNYQFEMERDSLEYQKQAELVVINAELEKQKLFKYLIISGFALAIVFVFIIYRNYRLKKIANDYLEKKNRIQEEKLKIEEQTRRQLETDNNQKARSLTATSLQLLNLNEKISELLKAISNDTTIGDGTKKNLVKSLENLRNEDNQWDSIKLHFENVHPHFFERLEQTFPELTPNDHKLLAFLKMKLSNKEIALILNVTTRAVEQSKRRLKKKISLDSQDWDIMAYINHHSSQV